MHFYKNINKTILFLILLFFFSFQIKVDAGSLDNLEQQVVSYSLKNGMKFLLVNRPGAPIFTGYIRVKVGGADEKEGLTGIAHMLEHMAFKGTRILGTKNFPEEEKILNQIEEVGIRLSELTRSSQENSEEALKLKARLQTLQKQADVYVIKEEFSRTYIKNGSSNFNATTSTDLTSYFVELPSNKLELWAYLESERLRDPVFREFYQERDVVMEERRMRVDNDPFGKLFENMVGTAFTISPYRVHTIGYEKDIKSLTATALRNFYNIYYVPQNMVGTIVGDIDIEETKKILEKYFGKIPPGKIPPSVEGQEPLQTAEKRSLVKFPARSELMMVFHKPTLPHRDDYVFDLIEQILCEGRTSSLYQNLVEKQKLLQRISCDSGFPGARLDNLFILYVTMLGSHTPQEAELALEAELEKFKNNLVSEKEMLRAKNQLISEKIFKISSNLGLAETLSYIEALTGDWRYLIKHEDVLESITPQEIQNVAKKYFVKNNRTISILSSEKP